MKDWVVLKFGGSSVARPRHWQNIASIIQARQQDGHRVMVVLSALKNVTNMLEAMLHQARSGVHQQALANLRRLHLQFAAELGLDGEQLLGQVFQVLAHQLDQVAQAKDISPKMHASVLAFGELMSTRLGAAYLQNLGLAVQWRDVRQWLVSQPKGDAWHDYLSAECDFQFDPHWCAQLPRDQVVVTQGFIAASPEGDTVLLGREGSDTTAAYLAAKLRAAWLEIWTDVPGIFTTDPREDPTAVQLRSLSYQQAADMTAAGARVLHHRALAPVRQGNIPVWIRATPDPSVTGTVIQVSRHEDVGPIAVVRQDEVVWLHLGNGCEHKFPDIVRTLSGCGFDILWQSVDSDHIDLLLYWANTDLPQPNLAELLDITPAKVVNQLARVTVIGRAVDTVQASFSGLLTENIQVVQQFVEPQQISWLVPASVGCQVQRMLHGKVRELLPQQRIGMAWRDWATA